MASDPRTIIDERPMSRFQWAIVATMVGLNALDGFDVLSISFASPGIAEEWGITRGALGFVLSMELIGMALGSLTLGSVADRIGRRNTILLCLMLMMVGMLGAAFSHNVMTLCLWRVFTGLGIGGMLAATNAAVAEAANEKRRSLAVVMVAAGYPLGTIVGGSICAILLQHYDWRAVFLFGALCSVLFVPLVLAFVPESISFLMQKRPPNALEQINKTLGRMGHGSLSALAEIPATTSQKRASLLDLFHPSLKHPTILLTIAYLAHIMTFYFILKWIPKIVVDMGFPDYEAAGVLVWASVGGATGSYLLGLLTAKIRVLALTMVAMAASTALVILFGQEQTSLQALAVVAACAGFASNAGVVGIYALVAQSFPTEVRATATGFVIGVGRGGSALAPAVAGLLFAAGFNLQIVAIIMSLGSLIGLSALFAFRKWKAPAPQATPAPTPAP